LSGEKWIILLILAIQVGVTILCMPSSPPTIVPSDGWSCDDLYRAYSFPFHAEEYTISAQVSSAIYYGAKEADKRGWYDHLDSFVFDERQDRFFNDILEQFHVIRDKQRLSSNRYLELITTFVQSIPYNVTMNEDYIDLPDILVCGVELLNPATAYILDPLTDPLAPPKFPVETFIDGEGDCDDKSLLLAALLVREDYATALLHFEDERHMAVGVQLDDDRPGFRNTGYGYIEVSTPLAFEVETRPDAEIVFEDGTRLGSPSRVIPLGGHINYTGTSRGINDRIWEEPSWRWFT